MDTPITETKQIKNKANIIIKGDQKQIQYFDENHYPHDGKIKPSITKKIGDVYRKGISFEQWLRDTGNESKVIAKEAAARGNKKHNAFENMIKGETVLPLNDLGEEIKFNKYDWIEIDCWRKWYEGLAKEGRLKPLFVEHVVYGEDTAGKIDFISILDGKVSITDWKTGSSIHLENFIQQAGYMKLWNESCDKLSLPKIERAYIVHTGSKHKGRSKGTLHDEKIGVYEIDYVKHTRLFELALEAWDLMNPNYKTPILDFPLEMKLETGILRKEKESDQ